MSEYVRVENVIYELDAAGNKQVFHEASSISKARKWVKEHRAKGLNIRVEESPQKSPQQLRKNEIAALTRAQLADRSQQRTQGSQLPRPYVMPDKDSSSFLRQRSARRNKSRVSRNGRAGFGST